jgi:hypothetical protein
MMLKMVDPSFVMTSDLRDAESFHPAERNREAPKKGNPK